MATPIFPTSIPGVSAISWGPSNPLQTDGKGPKTQRRLSAVPDATAQVTWRFLEGDFKIFLDFWKTDLLRGHRWFLLTLPCGPGFELHVVRFKSYHSARSEGFNFRTITAELEVRERKIRKSAVTASVTSRPYPLYDTDSIGNSVSVTGGFLSEGTATYAEERYELQVSVTAGRIVEYVPVDLPPQVEAVLMPLPLFMTLELKTILHETQQNERIGMGVSVTAGKLKAFIIQRYPEDAYDSTGVITGGYLT